MSEGGIYQDGLIVAKLLDSLQSNMAANQSLLAQMVEHQRATSTALAQIVEVQRDLTQKISGIDDIPWSTKDRILEGMTPLLTAITHSERTLGEIQTGLSNGYLRALREDITHLLESRTAQTIGSLTETIQGSTKTLDTSIGVAKDAMQASIKSLVYKFSFVFGAAGALMTLAVAVIMWIKK